MSKPDNLPPLRTTSLLTRLVAKVAPGVAYSRMVAEHRLNAFLRYEAAQASRLRGSPAMNEGPNSTTAQRDRIKTADEARLLEQNFAWVAAALDMYSQFVFPRIRWQAATGDREVDKKLEKVWNKWTEKCDVSGEKAFDEICRLAVRLAVRDGDSFVVKVIDNENMPRLQLLESDLIGGTSPVDTETKSGGIILDPDTLRRVEYEVYRRQAGSDILIPAERNLDAEFVIPISYVTRANQIRGVSPLAPAINTSRDYKETMIALRAGVKLEAMHAGVIYSENPDSDTDDEFRGSGASVSTAGNAEVAVEDIVPGTMRRLRLGEKAEFLNSNRPSTAFQGYMDSLLSEIAICLGLPPAFLNGLLNGRGPGVRADLRRAQRRFEFEQQRLVNSLLIPVLRWVLEVEQLRGNIEASIDVSEVRGRWQFGSHLSIDEGYDSKAMIEEYRAQFRTLAEIQAMRGMDWEEQMVQGVLEKVRMRELAQQYGVEVLDQTLLTPTGQIPVNGPTSPMDPAAYGEEPDVAGPTVRAYDTPTGAPPGSRAERVLEGRSVTEPTPPTASTEPAPAETTPVTTPLNGAQIESALSIMAQVGSGAIGQEAAIELLAALGLPRDTASKILSGARSTGLAPSEAVKLAAGDSFVPPAEVAEAAKRALEVRAEKPASQRGMTQTGIARARDLSNRRPLSLKTMKTMRAWFERHEVDKQGATWDEQGPGWQAWHGWGGDAGRAWVNRVLEEEGI